MRKTTVVLIAIILHLLINSCKQDERYNQYADATITTLQKWYNGETGLYETTSWWNAANALTAIIDYSRITGSKDYLDVIENTFENCKEFEVQMPDPKDNWICRNYINDYYDDEGWWILAWIEAYELTKDDKYLKMARITFADMATGWDDVCSGWLSYSDEELTEEVTNYKKRGFKSVKIKVGSKNVDRDIERLQKVRTAVGDSIRIMMDANQGMNLKNALILSKAASKIGIDWFEEPFNHHDYPSYKELKRQTNIKIAMGEREYNFEALNTLIKEKSLDLWQPDLLRIGGVEKWVASAKIAAEAGIPALPHYYKDYDIPLLCTIKNGYAVESFDWIDGLIDNTLEIKNGFTYPRTGAGWGFSFLKNKLIKLEI